MAATARIPAPEDTHADGRPGVARRPMDRRTLLKLGVAMLPGVVAGPMTIDWLVAQAAAAPAGTPTGALAAAVAGPDMAPIAAAEPGRPADGLPPRWGFVADVSRCIGCGFCVDACKLENHVPAEPEYNRTWVERHAFAADGTEFVDSPEGGIHGFPPESTAPGAAAATIDHAFFMPRLCMQCENPPCVSVCPVSATYRTDDGVILVDQSRCIGCGYCVVACPYGARYLVPSGGETPTGNAGVADKCTWCYHRISNGRQPACVEVCPVGARMFGDLDDPDSTVSRALSERPSQVLRPELGTRPRVSYVGLETAGREPEAVS